MWGFTPRRGFTPAPRPNPALGCYTSILCVWLNVPGKTTCGSSDEQWNKQRVDRFLEQEIASGATLVLPLASIIETGNHIAQANSQRYETAQSLAKIMTDAADEESPWAAFTEQSRLWDSEGLKQLAEELPNLAQQQISLGDATIKRVAEYYAKIGFSVVILTGDKGLKAFEPSPPDLIPRRRKR